MAHRTAPGAQRRQWLCGGCGGGGRWRCRASGQHCFPGRGAALFGGRLPPAAGVLLLFRPCLPWSGRDLGWCFGCVLLHAELHTSTVLTNTLAAAISTVAVLSWPPFQLAHTLCSPRPAWRGRLLACAGTNASLQPPRHMNDSCLKSPLPGCPPLWRAGKHRGRAAGHAGCLQDQPGARAPDRAQVGCLPRLPHPLAAVPTVCVEEAF